MAIKITITDQSLVESFFQKEKVQRTSGKGPLGDSWVISHHLRTFNRECLRQNIDQSKIIGIHLYLRDKDAVVSGINFPDNKTIKALSGRRFSYSYKTDLGFTETRNFVLDGVIAEDKFPAFLDHTGIIPLTVFFNSVVFNIKDSKDLGEDFYSAITNNLELLKETGREILPGGEPQMDCHMMDFNCELPPQPKNPHEAIAELIKKIKPPS